MSAELYYTPPDDILFDEVKRESLKLWDEVDSDNDRYGYATGKKNRIRDIENVRDNFMYMVAMFDIHNQRKLTAQLSDKARRAVAERMTDGGNPDVLNPFII